MVALARAAKVLRACSQHGFAGLILTGTDCMVVVAGKITVGRQIGCEIVVRGELFRH